MTINPTARQLAVVRLALQPGSGPADPLPKPREGMPCNGCGLCCIRELCHIGRMAYGEAMPAPCPGLLARDGRYWCKVVLAEQAGGLQPMARLMLGIDTGCDTEDGMPPLLPEELPA